MKSFLLFFLLSSTFTYAQELELVATCSNPILIEGELQVYLSKDADKGKVSLSGIYDYPATEISAEGPVTVIDYEVDNRTERIILTVDGGHEFHIKSENSNQFEKLGDLTCY